MQTFSPRRFEGGITELRQYHMVLVDTSPIYTTIQRNLVSICAELFIHIHETEELTGWCTTEVIQRAFPQTRVLGHVFNDRYQTVTDQYLTGMEHMFHAQIVPSMNSCNAVRCLRVLPMLDKTFIAIGT